jgi:polyphosphate kinase 2 (PPK2 family)
MKHAIEIHVADYRVKPGTRMDLGQWPTWIEPLYDSKDLYKKGLKAGTEQLKKLQRLLYAHNRYALLLIFQAMDAAGKDGAIRHVMSGVNPQGCQVFSFKHPSAEELEHDFLWRTHRALPERGRIGIFNRSYYEEVLIVRVRPEILKAQNLPDSALSEDDFWAGRYRSIVESEAHLHSNGTRIVKFFLHMSRESSASVSWRASTIRTKTGSSPMPTWSSVRHGSSTWSPTRRAWEPPARSKRRGTWCPPTTRRMPG